MRRRMLRLASSLVLVGLMAGPAGAVKPLGSAASLVEVCEYYGRYGAFAAALRDQGVSSGLAMDYVTQQIRETRKGPGVTAAGVARMHAKVTAIILSVYAHPELSPDSAKLVTYQACLAW